MDPSIDVKKHSIKKTYSEYMGLTTKVVNYDSEQFKKLPKAYIKTSEDLVVGIKTQEMYIDSAGIRQTTSIPTGHFPMIDMEAKIAHMSFVLFDHPITFNDQVLYFQSKSILDVFQIMITHKEIQMKLVGILVVGFSVIFPIIKMISSLAYYYNFKNSRKSKIIKFFVLKSGKWSMADVLVVAIFMAYIGFNGIINSQLGNISEFNAPDLEIISTNGTSLQPGYYLFLTYTLLAMFLSGFIRSRPHSSGTINTEKFL